MRVPNQPYSKWNNDKINVITDFYQDPCKHTSVEEPYTSFSAFLLRARGTGREKQQGMGDPH